MAQPEVSAGGVEYSLRMSEPASHLYEVEVRIPGASGAVELVMPSWTPGSYLLREFARNVQDFEALGEDGKALAWSKTDKGTWRVEAGRKRGEVRARYRVYANELTVRTSHLDTTHAYVNGASVFMFVRGREREALGVEVHAPRGWKIDTTLPAETRGRFRARDYDQLVDCPMEIGTHERLDWRQSGKAHRYAIWGRGTYDGARLVADTRKIIEATERLFGGLPYERYLFILQLFPGGRGGLEHADSCSLQVERFAWEGEEYESVLALVAHEFFHVWNAKRIRPEVLGPFDYTAESYTRDLWVVEGLTTYYTDVIIRRAGVISEERYLARQAESIARMQALPGRWHQTLAESSWDTWIKFYRQDENSPNSQVSYYHKGALVGLLLDLEIRRMTGGERSLDDVMQLLWERYGAKDVGYPEGAVEALAEEVAGGSLRELFDAVLRGTGELEYDRYLGYAGLRLGREEPAPGKPHPDAAVLEARLGVRVRELAGRRVQVASVLEGGAGRAAGLDAGDEVVAVEGLRVSTPAELAARVRYRPVGRRLPVAVFRRDELLTVEVELDPSPAGKLRIERVEGATAEQEAVRAGWLGAGVGSSG